MDEKTLTAQDCIDVMLAEPADVAWEFLQAHGLLDS